MGFACGGKVFQVGNCCIYFMCVVLGVDETRTFCGLSALVGCKGFCRVTSVFVFRFCLMVCFVLWHAVGCLGQHECCSVDHP